MSRSSQKPLFFSLLATLGLVFSCAVPQPAASQALRSQSGPYELQVLVNGVPARTYPHEGETHLLGRAGERYVLRVHNRSSRRIEAVVTVDGLDVIDGKAGDARKRGYLVPAWGYVDIDGWRLNEQEAAAFRFAAIADSYAAQSGRPRNIGVVGVAVFPERRERVVQPYPYRRYAPHEERREADDEGSLGSLRSQGEEPAAPSANAPPQPTAAGSGRAMSEDKAASAESARAAAPAKRRARSGLGTEFGEAMSSQIREVQFTRADPNTPAYLLGARYNDRAGLLALGIDVDGDALSSDLALRQSANPFPVSDRRYARPPSGWRRD